MKQAINTRTQEEYDALMGYFEAKDAVWILTGKTAKDLNVWYIRKNQTCIICIDGKLTHSSIDYCRKQNIPVIPYTEFAKANIVEEPDWKSLYLEGRELLERTTSVYSYDKDHNNDEGVLIRDIEQFLKKHDNGE